MLFYDKDDRVCLKISETRYKILYTRDIFSVDGSCYEFHYPYFYHMTDIDGDIYRDDGRTHVSHMNVKEYEEVGFNSTDEIITQ